MKFKNETKHKRMWWMPVTDMGFQWVEISIPIPMTTPGSEPIHYVIAACIVQFIFF